MKAKNAFLPLLAVNVVFGDVDNFCKAFAGAQVHISHIRDVTMGKFLV